MWVTCELDVSDVNRRCAVVTKRRGFDTGFTGFGWRGTNSWFRDKQAQPSIVFPNRQSMRCAALILGINVELKTQMSWEDGEERGMGACGPVQSNRRIYEWVGWAVTNSLFRRDEVF